MDPSDLLLHCLRWTFYITFMESLKMTLRLEYAAKEIRLFSVTIFTRIPTTWKAFSITFKISIHAGT